MRNTKKRKKEQERRDEGGERKRVEEEYTGNGCSGNVSCDQVMEEQ